MSSPAPPQSPVGAIETARRESQEAAYKQLHATLKELHRLDVPVLEDSHLQALGICKLPDIDVDEHAPFDPEPLFFRPYSIDDEEDLPGLVNGALDEDHFEDASLRWKKPCLNSYCTSDGIDLRTHCSCSRYDWVDATAGRFGQGVLGRTKWECFARLSCDDDMYTEESISHSFRRGWELLSAYGAGGFYELCLKNRNDPDLNKPHMGVAVCDAHRSSPATLASEVAAAITVLKFRFRRGEFIDFHTIPIIIYSFHHDESARITQAYWDGNALVIRQSRLLNLRSDRPTSDAYVLIRWIANKPVGETAYHVPQDTIAPGTGENPRADCATRWDISVGA